MSKSRGLFLHDYSPLSYYIEEREQVGACEQMDGLDGKRDGCGWTNGGLDIQAGRQAVVR